MPNVAAFPVDVCAAGHSKSVVILAVSEPARAQARCADGVSVLLPICRPYSCRPTWSRLCRIQEFPECFRLKNDCPTVL